MALAIASGSEGFAQQRQRFDEARSFRRDVAQRFAVVPNMTSFLVQAMASQEMASRTDDPTLVDPVCGCRFDKSGRLLQPTTCAAMRGIDDEEAARVDVFSLIDVGIVARNLACFREGNRVCVRDGMRFGGVTCCDMSDKDFVSSRNDPSLYVLAPKPLAERLRNLVPGRASTGSPEVCGIAIDAERGVYSAPAHMNGMLARAALVAGERYGAELPMPSLDLIALAHSVAPTRGEVAVERMVRFRYATANALMNRYLRLVPVSATQRAIGIR